MVGGVNYLASDWVDDRYQVKIRTRLNATKKPQFLGVAATLGAADEATQESM